MTDTNATREAVARIILDPKHERAGDVADTILATDRAAGASGEVMHGCEDVNSIPDAELVRRVIISLCVLPRSPRARTQQLWISVSHHFGLGSTYSAQLCRRFGFDPEQRVRP